MQPSNTTSTACNTLIFLLATETHETISTQFSNAEVKLPTATLMWLCVHNAFTVNKRKLNKKERKTKNNNNSLVNTEYNERQMFSTCSEMASPLVIPLEYSTQSRIIMIQPFTQAFSFSHSHEKTLSQKVKKPFLCKQLSGLWRN